VPGRLGGARPDAPSPRRGRLGRLLFVAWCLVAGYVLLLAPFGRLVWNEAFFAQSQALRDVLFQPWVRYGIAVVGGLLLVAAAWEIVTMLNEASRREES
jgi:hypothetical protein